MSAPSQTTDQHQSPPSDNQKPEHGNVALDQTGLEDEFKPSKLSRLQALVVDELKRNYNIDPTGEEYVLVVASSMNKGQSYVVIADSTDDQRYTRREIWDKSMIDKEMMDMMLNQNEVIEFAKQKLRDEERRKQEMLKKNG